MFKMKILRPLLAALLGGLWLLTACNTVVDDAVAIDVSFNSSCLVNSAGGVECWGSGMVVPAGPSNVAVPVPTLETGATDVAVGINSACAIQSEEVWCWGSNESGKLGNGTLVDSTTPVAVVGLPSVPIDVVLFGNTPCVLLLDGRVFCWGEGSRGEIGNGLSGDQSIAKEVQIGGGAVERLASGNRFTCAALASTVECWGEGTDGRLGNGDTADSNIPVQVTGLGPVTDLSLGFAHACVIETEAKCWGSNGNSELSNGDITSTSVPVSATFWNPVPSSFGLGQSRTCAVLANGEAHCLGSNTAGAAGNGTLADTVAPALMVGTDVVGVTDISSSSTGLTCVLGVDGSVRCTGFGVAGRLGNGDDLSSQVLVNVVR